MKYRLAILATVACATWLTAGTAQAAWNGSPYAPGATLNPECNPGVTNCGVQAPAGSGVNSNITELAGLTTPIRVDQGGTGLSGAVPQSSLLLGNGSSGMTVLMPGSTGEVLTIGQNGAPEWSTASGASGYTAGAGLELVGNAFTLSSDGISGTNIMDGAISTDDIADGAVTADKLANGGVALGKLAQSGCTAGQVPKWNGGSWDCGGDNDNSGAVFSNILGYDNTWTGMQIFTGGFALNGTIFHNLVGSGLVYTSGTLSSRLGNSISSSEIDDGTITDSDIANGTISPEKLSQTAKMRTVSAIIGTVLSTVLTPQEQAIFVAPTSGVMTRLTFTTSNGTTVAALAGTLSVARKTSPAGTVGSFNMAAAASSPFVPVQPTINTDYTTFSAGDVYTFKYNPSILGVSLNNLLVTVEYQPIESSVN